MCFVKRALGALVGRVLGSCAGWAREIVRCEFASECSYVLQTHRKSRDCYDMTGAAQDTGHGGEAAACGDLAAGGV